MISSKIQPKRQTLPIHFSHWMISLKIQHSLQIQSHWIQYNPKQKELFLPDLNRFNPVPIQYRWMQSKPSSNSNRENPDPDQFHLDPNQVRPDLNKAHPDFSPFPKDPD
jgi:hypothetical protein